MKEKKGFVTIGHGKNDLQAFILTLLKYRVNCLVDVRSSPYSKFSPQFNREAFEPVLKKYDVTYKWLGNLLGGRPDDLSTYGKDGVVDYDKLIRSKSFTAGLKELEELSEPFNVAIMCSEHDPIKCHRFLAISKELTRRGYRVVHILDMKNYIKQVDLEDKLIKTHFGENVQMDLFFNMDDMLSQSYIKQNKTCGYRRK